MKIFKTILRWVMYIIVFFITIFFLAFLLLKQPKVQTFIVGKVTDNLSNTLKTKVSIGKVDIDFFKTLVLEDVYVEDKARDTLLYAGKLKVNLGLLSLSQQKILLSYSVLENARVNIYKKNGMNEFNYDFIIEAFTSNNVDTTSSSWEFDMDEIELKNIHLSFFDFPGKTDLDVRLAKTEINLKTLGLNDQHLIVDNINLNGLQTAFTILKGTPVVVNDTTLAQNTEPSPPWSFTVKKLTIEKTMIAFDNMNFPKATSGIDYNHAFVRNLNGELGLDYNPKNYSFDIESLSLNEESGFVLNDLAVDAFITDTSAAINLSKFLTPHSDLYNELKLTLPAFAELQDKVNEIGAKASFDEDVISLIDVAYFAPQVNDFAQIKNQKIIISGDLDGKIDNIIFNDASVTLGKNVISGDFVIKGLPAIEKLIFDVNLTRLETTGKFISEFVPTTSSPVNIPATGNIYASGKFVGSINKFSSNASINTSLGEFDHNLNVRLNDKFEPQFLVGKLSVTSLNLGTLLKSGEGLGKLTMNAEVNATATEVNNFIANVDLFEYNNYAYKNITAEGTFKNKIGNASISISDSNLTADLNGYIDLNKTPVLYDFIGDFEDVNLHKLNLYSSPLTINTHLEMHMQGTDPDSLRGTVFASQLSVENDKNRFIIDTISAKADYDGSHKMVSIKSKILTGNISGNFKYAELGPASTHIMSHYFTGIKTPPGEHPAHIDSIRFAFTTGNLNGLTSVFMPSIQKLNGLDMKGSFTDDTHILLVDIKLKELTFSGNNINNINLNLLGDKEKVDINASTNTVFINDNFKFFNPRLAGTLSHDSLDFNIKMGDPSSKSNLDLDGILTFNADTFKLLLPRADMALQNNVWKISELAQIKYAPEYLDIQNLNLTSGDQSILINSDNTRRGNSLLYLEFKEVEIGNLAKLGGLEFDIQGQLNGKSEIQNLFTTLGVKSDLTLANLTAEKRTLGDLTFTANKPEGNDLLSLNASLSGVSEASLIGTYNFNPDAENLNLDFKISQLNTNAIEPFVKDILYDLNGKVLADLHISGKPASPMIDGKLIFKGFHTLGITSLQTVYNLRDQEISFMPNSVQLNKFTIYDTLQNTAVIDGAINHEQMKNFNFDLDFDTDNFQFLNSRYNSYVPYYGKFFAKVHVDITGPLEDLNIIADITTLENTDLYLNLQTDNSRQGLPSYISFVSRGVDSTGLEKIPLDSSKSDVAIDLSKFNIKSNLTVTKDAIINLVLDPNTGDMIIGRGNGNFQFNFDSNNAMNLYGTYTIDEGSYTFSFLSVVKKEFTIEKGSTVSWYGDPESGILDITAIYEAKASRYDLIADQAGMMSKEQISAAKRPQPVFVHLNMVGEFTKPEITFDIVVPEGTGQLTANAVTQKINQIKNNESELNKQVLGLIVFNKFFPEGGASGNDGSGPDIGSKASESVSGLLSSQLNELSAKYLQGVELNVNVENMNGANGNYNNINLTASKQLNDRVTVQAGSDIASGRSNSAGITGDYALLYRVNKAGNINLKFFRNSQTNIYNSNINYIQGASISHFKTFDSFRLSRRRKQQEDMSVN